MVGRSRGAQEKGHVMMIKEGKLSLWREGEEASPDQEGSRGGEGGQQEGQAPQPQSTHTGVAG